MATTTVGGTTFRAAGAHAGGTAQAQIMIPIPLAEGMGTVSLPRHVSESSWDVLFAIMKSYKPLLTRETGLSDTGQNVSDSLGASRESDDSSK